MECLEKIHNPMYDDMKCYQFTIDVKKPPQSSSQAQQASKNGSQVKAGSSLLGGFFSKLGIN